MRQDTGGDAGRTEPEGSPATSQSDAGQERQAGRTAAIGGSPGLVELGSAV